MAHDEATDEAQLGLLYWWGIPTLFRAPFDPDPSHCDIALVGVPHAAGNNSTERDQHLGPRAVRNVSATARRYHAAFDFDPWTCCGINRPRRPADRGCQGGATPSRRPYRRL